MTPPPPYLFCASVHYAWLSTNSFAHAIAKWAALNFERPFAGFLRGSGRAGQERRSLSRPPVGELTRDDNIIFIFGSSESVGVKGENFCHRVRTKGNWDVGRFGRVFFLARINSTAPPAHEALAPQSHPEAGVHLFYRERQPVIGRCSLEDGPLLGL